MDGREVFPAGRQTEGNWVWRTGIGGVAGQKRVSKRLHDEHFVFNPRVNFFVTLPFRHPHRHPMNFPSAAQVRLNGLLGQALAASQAAHLTRFVQDKDSSRRSPSSAPAYGA